MKSLRKCFQKARRASGPETALPPFDPDEFLELVHRQHANQTNWRENRRIRRERKQYPLAAELWEDLQDTYPLERFRMRNYHPPLLKVAAAFLLVSLLAAGIYALSRHYYINISVNIEKKHTGNTPFFDKRLAEVAAMIQDSYSRKVVFDRKELAMKLLSGRIDTTVRVEVFLDELRHNGVESYIDDKGHIHIK